MPEDRRMTISSSSHLAPDEVARHTFATVRRGFDPDEVRDYLESSPTGCGRMAEREQELLRALAEAEHRAANPVLDEDTLTAALGQETARVLQSAHEAAAEMVAKAEAEAERLLAEAREEIASHRGPGRPSSSPSRGGPRPRPSRRRAPAGATEEQVAAALDEARAEAEELTPSRPGPSAG